MLSANGTANGVVKASVAAPQPKMFVSYDDIHSAIHTSLARLQQAGYAEPDYLLAISGGALVACQATKQSRCSSVVMLAHGFE
jgi:hypothetical protein